MKVTVLYFASARERAGVRREEIELPNDAKVSVALEVVTALHPGLASLLPHLRVSLDHEFVTAEATVPPGAELALIPPVAGGADLFAVVDRPLAVDEVIAAVSGVAFGGLVTFSGSVRDRSRGRRVLRLEYEAYVPMAEKVLAQIGAEARDRWPGSALAVLHRVGILRPGELAVVIAAAAPHRGDAFHACQYAIDRLKEQAPIWKKEVYEDGEVWIGMRP